MHPARIKELLRMFNEYAPIARYLGMKLSLFWVESTGAYNATMLDSAGWFTAAAAHDIS